jgi:NADPH2:quinone reductase
MTPTARMRVLMFDGPAPDTTTTRVGERDVPLPGRGEVTIQVTHAGVNFKDIMARRGDRGYVASWPFVPGLEVAGLVHTIGDDVAELAPGQRVVSLTGEGGLAEFALADARLTVPIPESVASHLAAAAPGALLTAALLTDDLGHLQADETMLVHSAAGGVGHAAAQFARLAGVRMLLGTTGDPARVDAATRAGYDQVFTRGPNLAAAINAATKGRRVNLILDPQGTTMLDLDLQIAAPGARIILFGNAAGAQLEPLPPLAQLMQGNISLMGFSLASLAAADPARVAAALRRVLRNLAGGELSVDPTVVDDLASASEAQQALAEGRGATKYVVRLAV